MITKIKFDKFTAFDQLEIKCSPNINIFIGKNGTGKTHILKTLYAACDVIKSKKQLAQKITDVFLPSKGYIGRLVKRSNSSGFGSVEIFRKIEKNKEIKIRLSISNHMKSHDKAIVSGSTKRWFECPLESVYIPVKEMLSNAPGFRSLYSSRQISFDATYADIIYRALLPLLKGPTDKDRKKILHILQNEMEGKIGILHNASKVVYTFCTSFLYFSCLSCFSWLKKYKKCKVANEGCRKITTDNEEFFYEISRGKWNFHFLQKDFVSWAWYGYWFRMEHY